MTRESSDDKQPHARTYPPARSDLGVDAEGSWVEVLMGDFKAAGTAGRLA